MSKNKDFKKVLGLDIGSNSIGFSLLELLEKNNEIIFNELTSNSIVFSEPNNATDRREARSSRRRNERKSARNKKTRNIFLKYNIASDDFITDTSNYLNSLKVTDKDVYNLREKAVLGTHLTKDEFIFCTYSILTNRGYSNMFSISNEDGIINEAVSKNRKEYETNNFLLPSNILTLQRKNLENQYQNIPIRNKRDNYSNSLDRDMHIEEFKKVVLSQRNNKKIFDSSLDCENFIEEITDESVVNTPFYQRALKSFESMVEYCSFYDEFNPKGSQKRVPLSNVKNIELTLRQSIDNYTCVDKNGETKLFTADEKEKIIDFWLNTPNADKINNKNIFKNAGFKEFKIHTKDDKELLIINIQAYRNIITILNDYEIDYINKHNDFYNQILLELHYFKNNSSRVVHIKSLIEKHNLNLDDEFVQKIALLNNMDGFASFSLKFINEVLDVMKKKGKTHHESLESLGYYGKYLNMPTYDYLPPLEPTKADIAWLQKNVPYFKTKHLFYQPMMSPKVKRVISILRKLINEIIARYGRIDEIRIETAKEMNSKTEKEQIDKNQSKDRAKNSEALKFLKVKNLVTSKKNIEVAKLWKEQGGKCLYSGGNITEDEAFNEEVTEVEHFIPRSVIWINSYKNKILVKKKYNQNKGSKHPVEYLKSVGEWENFKGRVNDAFIAPNKKNWLTKEEIISSVMKKEHWQDSYLNDTRSATRAIQKYLNHYLYPKDNMYGKSEKRAVFSVSGRAISELKYIWGISGIMPKNEEGKKDRDTNYHHTLDAFTVALCSSGATNALHNHFKKNENKFKTKALKDKLTANIPKSSEGINVVEHLKNLVQKYESNKLYVCPFNKRKTNMKGFKDGNLKLYVTKDAKDETKEILAEMEKVSIDTSILIKIVGGFPKPRSDDEVRKEIKAIQERLNTQKQKKIIRAIEIYADKLLEFRRKIKNIDDEINKLKKTMKNTKQYKEFNDVINKNIKPFNEKKKLLAKQQQELKCSFSIKQGKKQIVKSLKLYKRKIEESKADAIVYPHRKFNKIERLSVKNFQQALQRKEPFVTKMNESTLNVQLFLTKSRGQAVGLNYFSSLANAIATKSNERYKDEINIETNYMTLYKNELIKVVNLKDATTKYYIFNGGGNISGSNNKIVIKNININTFTKVNRKGVKSTIQEDSISPSKKIIVSKVKIDFFGNIIEV